MDVFPIGAWRPLIRVVNLNNYIIHAKFIFFNGNRRMSIEVLGKKMTIWYDEVERSISNLRRDNGQNLPAFIDEVTGVVEDMQDARSVRICQPIKNYLG